MEEHKFTTFFEPFRIKSVEKLKQTTRDERIKHLKQANYNLYLLDSENILIDLLTDSGTGAMSSEQWAAVMIGDESYAGSPSYRKFEAVVKEIFGYRHVIPTHQGRAAERILFTCAVKEGDVVPNNAHFATTMANIEAQGGKAINFLTPEAMEPSTDVPFKGNMNVEKLEQTISKFRAKIPLVMITITNNMVGGEPVSMENIKAVSKICRAHGIPLFFDACRFAENAWFIKIKEEGYANRTPKEIAREIFSYGDGCTMSAKKDGLANIGGFLAVNDSELAAKCRKELLITEGFTTYGGLAGRDLEAIAVGLNEVVEEDYLRYQVGFVKFLADLLVQNHVPIVTPPGGHAVYIDAGAMLPHIPREQFPAWALGCALYVEGGIRGAEVGAVMLGGLEKHDDGVDSSVEAESPEDDNDDNDDVFEDEPEHEELFRLAIPRRTYTESHMRYVSEVCAHVYKNRAKVCGYQITWEPPMLRHFTAHLVPIPSPIKSQDDSTRVRHLSAKKVSSGHVLRRRRNSSLQFS
ncbi:tryptophanase-like [Porites lutea]|uniref:tryptophanase-like n=1 Tax=Porites lutea TaxID=51062 RepID=UPI003CC521F8